MAKPVALVREDFILHGRDQFAGVQLLTPCIDQASSTLPTQVSAVGQAIALGKLRRTGTSPKTGGQGPGSIVAAAPGETAANQLTCSGVARCVQTGNAGRALVIDNAQATRATHSAFQAQGYREHLAEGIDAQAVEGQDEIRLRQSNVRPGV